MSIRILTIIGARPQFIKAAAVSKALQNSKVLEEVIVHTGQHFDHNMSSLFFDELGIPAPTHQLDIHGGSHGEMTGRMLIDIERVIGLEKPDMILVYGDTNSTLAGALAAAKLHIPVAHVEAGLRSFNMKMPEEINRILTDQISTILFCPTQTAVEHLLAEGFEKKPIKIELVGDVMQDSALLFEDMTDGSEKPTDLPDGFVLATFHRAENTDDPRCLKAIVDALNRVNNEIAPVFVPLHPRTRAALEKTGLKLNCHVAEPVGYIEMIRLLKSCGLVITDSGGLQKEAFFFGKPCVTMREQTEWTELLDIGANKLVGTDTDLIVETVRSDLCKRIEDPDQLYGGGTASNKIADILEDWTRQ